MIKEIAVFAVMALLSSAGCRAKGGTVAHREENITTEIQTTEM